MRNGCIKCIVLYSFRQKYLCCVGLARFSESITYYLANIESTSHNDIRQNTFEGEMLSAYEILFNVWIKSSEAKVITASFI